MLKLFERGKLVFYLENEEDEKLEKLTFTELNPDADDESILAVSEALNSLCLWPVAYILVEEINRITV